MQRVNLSELHGADYNPRFLSEEAKCKLKSSISRFGQIKAIVINDKGLILAGHQRTKCMTELGLSEAYAFVLNNVSKYDEVRFNQLHNLTEVEYVHKFVKVTVDTNAAPGWYCVDPKSINVDGAVKNPKVHILARLIHRYGEFANSICDEDGNVFISTLYAVAAKNAQSPLTILKVKKSDVEPIKAALSLTYGEFCYDGLKKNTYVQTYAQKPRLAIAQDGKSYSNKSASRLYDYFVIPFLKSRAEQHLRIIDFGAGKLAYANLLHSKGFDISPIEFYPHADGKIIVSQVYEQYRVILDNLKTQGLFDVVVCDSVLNSTDSQQAWQDVINTCIALCKEGGQIFISGRTRLNAEAVNFHNHISMMVPTQYFLDKNGFSANYRNGCFFYQKFDTKEQIEHIIDSIGSGAVYSVTKNEISKYDEKSSRTYFCVCQAQTKLPIHELMASVTREFSLPLPGGKRYDFAKTLVPVLRQLRAEL